MPYQYFSDDCESDFNMTQDGRPSAVTSVICTGRDSVGTGLVSFQLYSIATRPETISGATGLFDFSLASMVRIRIVRGSGVLYSINRFRVMARLNCHGHGSAVRGATTCNCSHHTTGDRCEQCLPLFNGNPYVRWTTATPFGCSPCECNGHASSCSYSMELESGVCDCEDHTTGEQCGQCSDGYFREPDTPLSSPDVCQECPCVVDGTEPSVCVRDIFDASGADPGTCLCKARVTGSSCGECAPGFTHLRGDNPLGCDLCTACTDAGTDPDNACLDGRCACKMSVTGPLCDTCVGGSFGLNESNPLGCDACMCSARGTIDGFDAACDVVSGQCPCITGWSGRTCDVCDDGYYLQGDQCVACECSQEGAVSKTCDADGMCSCSDGYTGPKCDACDSGYKHAESSTCVPCACSSAGSLSSSCNESSGQCPCKRFVTGVLCDSCIPGFGALDEENPDGCSGTPGNLSAPIHASTGTGIVLEWRAPRIMAGPIVRYELYRDSVLVFSGLETKVIDTVTPGGIICVPFTCAHGRSVH